MEVHTHTHAHTRAPTMNGFVPLTYNMNTLCCCFAGYYGDQNAIIVFAACFLPDSNCENYNYVMENLFL